MFEKHSILFSCQLNNFKMRNESLRSWDIKTFLQFNCSIITALLKIVRKRLNFVNCLIIDPIKFYQLRWKCASKRRTFFFMQWYTFSNKRLKITNSGSSRIKYDFIITIEYIESWWNEHMRIAPFIARHRHRKLS